MANRKQDEVVSLQSRGDFRGLVYNITQNLIQTERWVSLDYETIEDAVRHLNEAGEGLTNPRVELRKDYDGDSGCYVIGWRPPEPEEMRKIEHLLPELRENQRQAKLSTEQREREEYNRLRKKFE